MVRYRCGGVDGVACVQFPPLPFPLPPWTGEETPAPPAGRVGVGGSAVLLTDFRAATRWRRRSSRRRTRWGWQLHRIETPADALYDPAQVHTLRDAYAPDGFTDILIFGDPTPEVLEAAQDALCYGGALSFTCHRAMPPVPVDVGRLHYDRLLVMGTSSWDITDAYRHTRDTALAQGRPPAAVRRGGRDGADATLLRADPT
jgi:hypothetical protein